MPEIAVTADQRERLRWIQRRLAEDVTYGHVRPCDALDYLLDRAEASGALAEIDAEKPVTDAQGQTAPGRADATASAAEEPTESGTTPASTGTETVESDGLSHTIHTSSSANTVRIATPSANTNGTGDDAADAVSGDNDENEAGDTDESDATEETDGVDDEDAVDGGDADDAEDANGDDSGVDDDDVDEGDGNADGAGAATLNSMMNLLDAHGDKWREADGGEAKYEVDLPDGSTEAARTKDDVKAVLFKQYR
jgi:hypothetical protein